MKQKIFSWNVNSIRARLENFLFFLKSEAPDTVLLQETKCLEEHFPFQEIEEMGYNCLVSGQKTYNGVAIISKHKIEEIHRCLPNFTEDKEARYLEAIVNGAHVLCVYVPQGNEIGHPRYEYKERFYSCLTEHIKSFAKNNLFVMAGDFNVALYDNDVWKPENYFEKVPCTTNERKWLNRMIQENSLHDILCQYKEGKQKNPFTWWHYRFNSWPKQMGLRIDHIFLTSLEKLSDCGIMQEARGWPKPSDHAPIWVELFC